jgi:hypothetical protein
MTDRTDLDALVERLNDIAYQLVTRRGDLHGWIEAVVKPHPADTVMEAARTITALIERLRAAEAENARLSAELSGFMDDTREVEAFHLEKLSTLEAENARLREALVPFAEAMNEWDGQKDSQTIWVSSAATCIDWADLRRARAALAQQDGQG